MSRVLYEPEINAGDSYGRVERVLVTIGARDIAPRIPHQEWWTFGVLKIDDEKYFAIRDNHGMDCDCGCDGVPHLTVMRPEEY